MRTKKNVKRASSKEELLLEDYNSLSSPASTEIFSAIEDVDTDTEDRKNSKPSVTAVERSVRMADSSAHGHSQGLVPRAVGSQTVFHMEVTRNPEEERCVIKKSTLVPLVENALGINYARFKLSKYPFCFKFMARSGKQWGANLYVQKSRGSEGGAVLSRWDTLCSTLKLKKGDVLRLTYLGYGTLSLKESYDYVRKGKGNPAETQRVYCFAPEKADELEKDLNSEPLYKFKVKRRGRATKPVPSPAAAVQQTSNIAIEQLPTPIIAVASRRQDEYSKFVQRNNAPPFFRRIRQRQGDGLVPPAGTAASELNSDLQYIPVLSNQIVSMAQEQQQQQQQQQQQLQHISQSLPTISGAPKQASPGAGLLYSSSTPPATTPSSTADAATAALYIRELSTGAAVYISELSTSCCVVTQQLVAAAAAQQQQLQQQAAVVRLSVPQTANTAMEEAVAAVPEFNLPILGGGGGGGAGGSNNNTLFNFESYQQQQQTHHHHQQQEQQFSAFESSLGFGSSMSLPSLPIVPPSPRLPQYASGSLQLNPERSLPLVPDLISPLCPVTCEPFPTTLTSTVLATARASSQRW